jgi:glycosyltransferase involved in cell wall biosynthesis
MVDEVIDGIDHHWVATPGGIHRSRARRVANYGLFATAAAARALALPRPDVVYISSPPLTVAPLGPLLARRFRAPWLLEVRDIWPESAAAVGWLSGDGAAYRMLDRLARSVTRRAAVVIVPTPGLEPLVRAHGARRVETLTGMVVPRRFDDSRRSAARERLRVAADECLFLYVGAIGVANGLDLLVDALELVPDGARIRVVVAGDGSARAELERRLTSEHVDRIPSSSRRCRRRCSSTSGPACLSSPRPRDCRLSSQPTAPVPRSSRRRSSRLSSNAGRCSPRRIGERPVSRRWRSASRASVSRRPSLGSKRCSGS